MSYHRTDTLEVPMSSPPQKVLAPSDFMSCSGLVKDKPKGYKSFPESGHAKSALDFMNESDILSPENSEIHGSNL
jgi:hypothetical protein